MFRFLQRMGCPHPLSKRFLFVIKTKNSLGNILSREFFVYCLVWKVALPLPVPDDTLGRAFYSNTSRMGSMTDWVGTSIKPQSVMA